MTRINIIPPCELYDQHLVAEYREIFMIPGSLKRTLISKVGYVSSKVPSSFTLNTGHVYFFYNKGLYLEKRYQELRVEMKARGMTPDPDRIFPRDVFPAELYNDWIPTRDEQNIVRRRIAVRVAQRPNWYRKTASRGEM